MPGREAAGGCDVGSLAVAHIQLERLWWLWIRGKHQGKQLWWHQLLALRRHCHTVIHHLHHTSQP